MNNQRYTHIYIFTYTFFAVPEYQVVSIHSRSKRSMDENRLVSFNAFGKDVRLHLEKNPHLVKQSLRMWIAEPDSSEGVNYKELPQVCETTNPTYTNIQIAYCS